MARDSMFRMTCVVKPQAEAIIKDSMKVLGCKNLNQYLKKGIAILIQESNKLKKEEQKKAVAKLRGKM